MNILHDEHDIQAGYLHGNAEAGLVSHPHGGGTENPEHQAEIPEHDRPELRKREGIAGFGGFPLVLLQNLSAARGKAPLSAFAFGSEQCANQKPSYQETNGGRGIPLNGQRDKRRKKKTSPVRLAASVGISPFSARAMPPAYHLVMIHPYAEYGIQPRSVPLRSSRGPCHDPRKSRPLPAPGQGGIPLRIVGSPFPCVQGFAGGIVLPRAACRLAAYPDPSRTPEVSSPAIPRSTAAAARSASSFPDAQSRRHYGFPPLNRSGPPSPVSKISEISKTGPCRRRGSPSKKTSPLPGSRA